MFEEHFNSDTLMAVVICGFFITLALIIVTTCLMWPGIEMKTRLRKEEHDDYRRIVIEENRKFVKRMIDIHKLGPS